MSPTPDSIFEELSAALERLRAGDYSVSVSFAGQDGALGRLGSEFNETVRALRERQGSGDSKAISRLVHDIKNPLAGIAGVIEIMAQDLPADSPSREVLPEVRAEVEHINQLLAEFAQGKQ